MLSHVALFLLIFSYTQFNDFLKLFTIIHGKMIGVALKIERRYLHWPSGEPSDSLRGLENRNLNGIKERIVASWLFGNYVYCSVGVNPRQIIEIRVFSWYSKSRPPNTISRISFELHCSGSRFGEIVLVS